MKKLRPMKKIINRLQLFALTLLVTNMVFGLNTDSLKIVLLSSVNDSVYYGAADNLAWEYMYKYTDSAILYENIALARAIKMNDEYRVINSQNTLGVCNIVIGNYLEAITYLDKALEGGLSLLKYDTSNNKYKRRLLATYANKGNVYYYQAIYDKAIDNYMKSLKLSEKLNYQPGISTCISNIGASYIDLGNYPKALEYQHKALHNAYLDGDNDIIVQCLANLGSVFFGIPNYDSAYYYFSAGYKIAKDAINESNYTAICVNLGDVFREREIYDSAYYYYNKALELSKKLNFTYGLINCNYMIGQYYMKFDDYKSAEKYFTESLNKAKQNGTQRFIMLTNEELSNIYKKQGNYELAYNYYLESSKIREIIFNNDREKTIADMEAKYRMSEKEKQIIFLNEKTKLLDENVKITRITFGSISLILILILAIIVISYRSYKHKQLAEKRKIQQESERNLLDAIINTEYKERKRFAEDLHDGLGVLLSTLRLYLNEIKNTPNETKREEIIVSSNTMLDDAIQNVRNISNNIMPAALKRDGLALTLRSFCDKINASGKIKIKPSFINFKSRLQTAKEISLYRVLTELINNTLKHANATEIRITFTVKGQNLFITYRDNGCGFDYEKMIKSDKKGLGLNNILSRIKSIDGVCTIKSRDSGGFFAGIEVGIN